MDDPARSTPPARDRPVLVTGGTGTLGRLVVPRLRAAGCEVRVLSRGDHEPEDGVRFVKGDLADGTGLEAAVDGAEVVLHLAGSSKGDAEKASNLLAALEEHGDARHLVYVSVVGSDRIPVVSRTDRMMFGYFEAKLAAEHLIRDSGVPFTTLRATQFHDLLLTTARGMSKLPVIPVPAIRFQPIEAEEVAVRLVQLALAEPAGLVPELAGPQVLELRELIRTYLRAAGKHRLLMPMRQPGKAARAFREGANLAPDRAVGRRTWEDFLADRVGSPAPASQELRNASA